MKEVDFMVFDLDGTLVDSAQDIIAAANHTRNLLGLAAMEDETIVSFVGDGTDKLVERFIGPECQHRRGEAIFVFNAYYDVHQFDNTTLYHGVTDVLEFFGHKRKVIITNKHYHYARKIADVLGIAGCFDEIIGIGSTPFSKPDARILLPLLERFHVDENRAIIFGDGINDIKLAKNTGIQSCALLNGFTPRNTLLSLKPDFACERMEEVKGMFC